MVKLKILLFLIVYSVTYIPAKADTLSHVKFKHDFEKSVFLRVVNGEKVKGIHLLLAITDNADSARTKLIEDKIKHFRQGLESKKFTNKSEQKRLKMLFDETHREFFSKYIEVSNFGEIFSNRNYNCVSASGLYSLILDHYDIPHVIKEAPSHVFILAYPNTLNILLESTAPIGGYYNPGDNEIKKAVEQLVELKYVTKQEVEEKGIKSVFNEFFYGNDDIDIRQLAGLQYYNEALSFIKSEDYSNGLNSLEKASILYPSNRFLYLKTLLLTQIINTLNFSKIEEIHFLVEYFNLVNKDEQNTYGMVVVEKMLKDHLFKKDNVEYVDSTFTIFREKLCESALLNELSEFYLLNLAQYYYQKSDYTKTVEKAKEAYELNPKNVNAQSMILDALVRSMSLSTGSMNTLRKLEGYAEEFPYLKDNLLYKSFYFFNCAAVSYRYFLADDLTNGHKYLKYLEDEYDQFGDKLKLDETQFGMVYAEAGACYFRKRNYTKAKSIIEQGLALFPDHPELTVRLQIVVDEMRK